MVESSHVKPGLRRSSTTRRPSMRGILARDEAVNAATAAVARTPDAETNQQPRGEKRKAGALSGDREKGADSGTSDVDSEASEEGSSVPKKKKGKEREHTPEEDSQEESVAKNNGSDEQLSEEVDEDEEEAVYLEEEDLEDDDEEPLYHHSIWNRLVNLANDSGSYVHPPAKGDEAEDVTAFKACSASWGMDRANRPHVLSLWMPRTPQNDPDYDIEHLTYNNRVVLDWEGKLIRDFKELPATIASTVEGWRVEAWLRKDKRVTYRDIVARMRTKADASRKVPIYGTRALATRANNFRDHAGCISWKLLADKVGSRAYMDGLRTPIQRRHNLTTHQDLSSAQLHAYYGISRSRYSHSGIAATAGPSAPDPNAGSSRRSRRKATDSGAAGLDTSGPSAPLRRSGRRKTSRLCQPGSPRNEAGEHNEHEQYESDDDERLLDTSLVDEDEEEAALETSLVNESEDEGFLDSTLVDESKEEELFDASLFDEIADEALVDTNLISEGEEDAQLPDPISLKEGGERLEDSVSGSSDYDSNDSASEYSISGEPEDHKDARNHIPADMDKATMLQAALDATREDFKRLTGRDPTKTDPMENYFSQWAAYQTQLSMFFETQGKTDDRTILVGLGGWGGGISNWRSARPALGEGADEDQEL